MPISWLIDMRKVFLDSDMLRGLAAAFWDAYRDTAPFQVAGMESAAIPLLTAILLSAPASRGRVNGFIVRKERKQHGLCNSVEGEVTDEPVVLIDDVLNSGRSAGKALAVILEAEAVVKEVFVVIDYCSTSGLGWRGHHGIVVRSLFKLSDFAVDLAAKPKHPEQRYDLLWHHRASGGNAFYMNPKSAPLVSGDRIFRGCDAGSMQCFDAATGTVLWDKATGPSARKGIWSTPALASGRLFYGAYDGVAYCLDAETGREVWTALYCDWIGASPLVVEASGLVFFGFEYARPWAKGGLAALDMRTGRRMWERPVERFQHGSPAFWPPGGLVIWGTADHEMLGLDAKTGAIVWTFRTRRSVKCAPTVDEGTGLVAFASFDKSIYVLDAATGAKRGEWETGGVCYTTPLISDGRLYCGSGDRHLYVVDLAKMELVAKLDMRARIFSSPRRIDRRIVFGTTSGRIVEINAETHEIEGVLQVPDAVTDPVGVSGDRMYVSTYMNDLYALRRIPSQS